MTAAREGGMEGGLEGGHGHSAGIAPPIGSINLCTGMTGRTCMQQETAVRRTSRTDLPPRLVFVEPAGVFFLLTLLFHKVKKLFIHTLFQYLLLPELKVTGLLNFLPAVIGLKQDK